ncbi:MAG: hypothetical protein Q9165_000045 [Trypethelium subeluteriae]
MEVTPTQNPIEQDGGQLSTSTEKSPAAVPGFLNEAASTHPDAIGGGVARNSGAKRGKTAFQAEQLSEALPKDVEEFRDAFRGIQEAFLQKKKG